MPTQQQLDTIIGELPNVGVLVHLAMRMDSVDEQAYTTMIFKSMRTSYEDELTRQAAAIGCPGRVGRLREGQELSELKRIAQEHAASIVRTFNYDLAQAIIAIRIENPRANRNYYAKRLTEWARNRAAWKDKQIALMTVQIGRQRGREAFVLNNPVTGKAYVFPKTAAEHECQHMIDTEPHPLETVYQKPFPFHYNCVHGYKIVYSRIPKGECALLWMG